MIGRQKDEKKEEEEEKLGEDEDKDPKKTQTIPCLPYSVTSILADKFLTIDASESNPDLIDVGYGE